MKWYFFIVLMSCIRLSATAQESIIQEIDNDRLQKYITMARSNFPRVKQFNARTEKTKNLADASKMSWFDVINAGYYYYPNSSTGGVGGNVTPGGQIVTRGFMFGVTANLGSLLSKPFVVKAAKSDYDAARAEAEEYNLTLANEVRSRYYDYLSGKKQLAIRNLAAQSLKGIQTDAQLKYEKGEIAIDVYTTAKNAATEADALALTAEVNYLKAKNALEDIIGAKLETVK